MKQALNAHESEEGKPEITADDSSLTDTSPLLIPYIDQGTMYLVGLGHFTIGWREYADWSVTFSYLKDGKLMQKAMFAVGMWKGSFEIASVN